MAQAVDFARTGLPADPIEDFFENGAIGLHLLDADGVVLRANRADMRLLGYPPDEFIGRPISDFHVDPTAVEDMFARLMRGEALDRYRAQLRAKDGSIKHVLVSSSVCRDEAGRFRNTRCFTVDITERVAAEAALQEAQQRLAATYENALAVIAEVDRGGQFVRVNAQFESLTGYPRDALLGLTLFDLTHPDDAPAEQAEYTAQVRGEIDRYGTEKRIVRADGRTLWVQVMSSSVRDPGGEFLYGVRVVHDVTDRRLAEERTRLLLNELNHRVKNALATAQSLATQTARHATDVPDFMARFEGRLVALSKAHDHLTRRNWENASLAGIVEAELELHGGAARGLIATGPDVALPARTALSLSMAFHELATNAVKYGALSTPSGRIEVSWTLERDPNLRPVVVRLAWVEIGGPVPSPGAGGFGSRFLKAMARETGGEAELVFDPAGVCWRHAFPIES